MGKFTFPVFVIPQFCEEGITSFLLRNLCNLKFFLEGRLKICSWPSDAAGNSSAAILNRDFFKLIICWPSTMNFFITSVIFTLEAYFFCQRRE